MEAALSERKYGTVMAQAVGIYVCYLGIGEKLPEASYLFLVAAVKPYNGTGFGVVLCTYKRWISHCKKSGLALITTAYRFLSLNQGNTSFSCLSQNLLTALFSGTSITKQKKYFLNVVKLIILVTSKRAIIIWNGAKTSIHG